MTETTFEIIPAEVSAVSTELTVPAERAMALFVPFQQPFTIAVELLQKESEATTAEQARELRLKMVKARTAFTKVKDESKSDIKLAGNIIDWYHNKGRDTLAAAEARLREIEEEEERKEAARMAALKDDRTKQLAAFDVDGQYYRLGEIPEEGFQQLLEASRISFEAKMAAEEKAREDARIAAEKAEAERIERERLEAEERARIKAEAERLKIENERLEKERIEAEATAQLEREKLETEAKAAAEKARKEREEIEAKAKADADAAAEKARKEREAIEKAARLEREEIARKQAIADEQNRTARFEAELAAKAEAARLQRIANDERKKRELIEAQEQARIQAEEKRHQEEQAAIRKAAAAPDKEKLRTFAEQIKAIQIPALATNAGQSAVPRIENAIANLINLIRTEYKNL